METDKKQGPSAEDIERLRGEMVGLRQDLTVYVGAIQARIDNILTRMDIATTLEPGTSIALTDADGAELSVGDLVEVTGSERFGTFQAEVRGPAPDIEGRNNPRVRVPHPEDPDYTTSVLRVRRLTPATPKSAVAEKVVIEGPYGHWYAWHNGELVGLPMDAEGGKHASGHQPEHPSSDDLGWYAVVDLPGPKRQAVLTALGHGEDG